VYDWLMSVGEWIETSPIAYAEIEWGLLTDFSIVGHYFGFFMVVGVNLAVDLRILGVRGRNRTASELAEQFFPWAWRFLGIVVLTGSLYLSPSARAFFSSSFFLLKLLLMLLAIVSSLLIQWNVRKWEQAPATPLLAKVLAVVSLLLWIGTILAGTHVPIQTLV